ncbi:zinc-binding dehydrogenase [Fusarium pseudocircinatum]|uniref:Zinc-binding dehydrogenase n=1 Tax=Fusarium pseudocircinatum TaxID=56676 RepID=A0A8H5UT43_9HYPO|nr:zinc-binding dehydrogenase [Fusarium pseudocircinatum]
MATDYPPTHPAVAITARRAPLSILEVPTEAPGPGEVLIHVQWTASSPGDLHQADGDLVDDFPFLLGCSFAGTVVGVGPKDSNAVSPETKPLEVGDRVSGFIAGQPKHAGFQIFVTVPSWATGRIPENLSFQEAITVPVNLVTAFHAITKSLGLDLPWPLPPDSTTQDHNQVVLVWGAAGSVGNYVVQVLHHWGYKNVLAVASRKHHEELASLGAAQTFDYHDVDVVEKIISAAERIPYVLDCIGDVEGSLRPLTKIARHGSRVAVVAPIIIRHASQEVEPQLTRDPSSVLISEWEEGVEVVPVMTFFYQENEFFKWHLQSDVIPELLRDAHIKPNKHRIVDGDTLLERAQTALDLLRDRAPSGERLVWKVSDS